MVRLVPSVRIDPYWLILAVITRPVGRAAAGVAGGCPDTELGVVLTGGLVLTVRWPPEVPQAASVSAAAIGMIQSRRLALLARRRDLGRCGPLAVSVLAVEVIASP
jgi:hypothetical protein